MLLSLNLLKKYINLPKSITPDRLALDMTEKVVEVEEVINKSKELDSILVGKVEKVLNHPNADKLKLVDVKSDGKYRVICGGSNLKTGMLVAFAKTGAMIKWHGEGELVKLEKVKIRGEESNGMICAADEIGLQIMFPHDEGEIMDLTKFDLPVGTPIGSALSLDDIIIDIDNKSITNRPDLWGHFGMARELAAIYNLKLKSLELLNTKTGKSDLKISIKDKNLCARYLGCMVDNIKIEESPEWLKKQLLSLGAKPINNIVDITNYVLLELGQPLHAFDSSKVSNITVRRAKNQEKIITLDEEERKLDEDMLVIADNKKPIALAGVMGGLESGVSDKTSSIILEAASFDAVNIRQTSQKLGLRTEASARFEKGLHPKLAEIGMQRVLQLIKEIIPKAKITNIIDENYYKENKNIIKIDLEFIQKRIGVEISEKEVKSILEKLGFKIDSGFMIEAPWWRSMGDISIAEDIVEEVARIYGYDKIVPEMPKARMEYIEPDRTLEALKKIRELLSKGCGMMETYNYSFLAGEEGVKLDNPLSEDLNMLRNSLLPGLLKNTRDNSRFYDKFKLFEIGRVFLENIKNQLPYQPYYISGVVVGGKKDDLYLEIKGIVEETVKLFKINLNLDWIQEIDSDQLKKFGIKNRRVFAFEIDLEKLIETQNFASVQKYKSLPKYPFIIRDIAIEVDNDIKWKDILKNIININKLIEKIEFLSVYNLGDGKKSVAFRVIYRAEYKTLKDEEAIVAERKILDKLTKEFNARLRS